VKHREKLSEVPRKKQKLDNDSETLGQSEIFQQIELISKLSQQHGLIDSHQIILAKLISRAALIPDERFCKDSLTRFFIPRLSVPTEVRKKK